MQRYRSNFGTKFVEEGSNVTKMDFASNKLYPNVTLFRFRQALFCNYKLLWRDFTIKVDIIHAFIKLFWLRVYTVRHDCISSNFILRVDLLDWSIFGNVMQNLDLKMSIFSYRFDLRMTSFIREMSATYSNFWIIRHPTILYCIPRIFILIPKFTTLSS